MKSSFTYGHYLSIASTHAPTGSFHTSSIGDSAGSAGASGAAADAIAETITNAYGDDEFEERRALVQAEAEAEYQRTMRNLRGPAPATPAD